ncbi:SGNH/GDSL hydrolase family protein [Nodularia spumigena]|uniref:SGNH/GDSL hydrolase family protein n=1 Tax=Nodularia spumigena TaxID=70799 RepID=UPI002B20FCAE|nr:SGNH/GDSL hydrolase family protein [Nodularia spumigena]MEA5613131.1 SGNH/GDSL hydrolase family protein [Nodularia spumigena UHCC 0040]
MRTVCLMLVLLVCVLSPALAQDGVRWVDASTLELQGRGFDDAAGYQRLPERFRERVPERVWELSTNSAGLVVRFATDAAEVRARWTTGPLLMNNLSPLAVRGLDLYTLGDAGWSYLGTARPKVWGTGTEHEYTIVSGLARPDGLREMALYLPLYESVGTVEIGVPEGAVLEGPLEEGFVGPPVVVYGTSITQGASASRPGLAFPAILGRMLGREVINLGFSGTGRLDPGMGDALAEIEAAVYVLDCQPNLRADEIEERTVAFVTTLRERRPGVPIVLVDNILYPGTADRPDLKRTLDEKRAALRRAIERLGAGTVTLVAIGPDEVAGEDESADGIHPTDEGMRRHAVRLRAALGPLLGEKP